MNLLSVHTDMMVFLNSYEKFRDAFADTSGISSMRRNFAMPAADKICLSLRINFVLLSKKTAVYCFTNKDGGMATK